MVELLGCPFCGGKAHAWQFGGEWYVSCSDNNHEGLYLPTEAEAIAAWNQRTPSAPSAVVKAGQFLIDRLDEFENELTDEEAFTQFNGNVTPALARFRAALKGSE